MLSSQRVRIKRNEPDIRSKSFNIEVMENYTDAEAVAEASRCIGCNLCSAACPASLDISGYIRSTAAGDPAQTIRIIMETLPFPAIIGRVCTHMCEDVCVMYDESAPIAIRHLKRYAADKFNDYGQILKPQRRAFIDKRIAIIGGGPAGLTVAYYLALQGVKPTIFEALPELGGFMKTGIPRYRLPQEVLDKEIGYIVSRGVNVHLNTAVGKDIKFEDIMKDYDAVFLGVGNHKPRMTGTPGSDAPNVMHATEFLQKSAFGVKMDVGDTVIIIGGGFTANDSSRTALRLGAKHVYIMYRRRDVDRPGYPSMNADEDMEETQEESIEYVWEVTPFEYVKENGRVVAMKYWKNEMVSSGKGRAKPVPIKDKIYTVKADLIIEATGQETDYDFLGSYAKQLRLTDHGDPIVDQYNMTSIPGVFTGGDSTNPNRDLISAVRDADIAVQGILKYLNLMNQVSWDDIPILDRYKPYSYTAAMEAYKERGLP